MSQSVFLLVVLAVAAARAQDYEFPQGFAFGCVTSAHQVEGAWNQSGKGENIWDRLTHEHPELMYDGSNADVACNSYYKAKEDVQLLKNLGVNTYRFSLSWSRILPKGGIDLINEDGIRYYNDLINELIANNINPMVTIYHWDLPQALMDIGGWPNKVIIDYFLDYAELVFREFGDRVKNWITFNEPYMICYGGWGDGSAAPRLPAGGVGDYLCTHNLLLAHGQAYRMYQRDFKATQQGQIGFTTCAQFMQPEDPQSDGDIAAAERAQQWMLGLYANPIFSRDGDYPAVIREMVDAKSREEGLKRSRLPQFTPEEVEMVKGSSDFFGLNIYTAAIATHHPADGIRSQWSDGNFTFRKSDAWTATAADWMKETPWAMRGQLQWIKNAYVEIPIVITENGYPDDGQLKDVNRVKYLREYLNSLLEAVHIDRVNVTGYMAWSLTDNYEWFEGYVHKFGLYSVDFNDPNRTRTPKMSAKFYQEVIQTNRVPDTDPEFPDDGRTATSTWSDVRSTAVPTTAAVTTTTDSHNTDSGAAQVHNTAIASMVSLLAAVLLRLL